MGVDQLQYVNFRTYVRYWQYQLFLRIGSSGQTLRASTWTVFYGLRIKAFFSSDSAAIP
ncbi:hypothetical protein L598_003100000020 [Mesorhizobium sp. J18]|nr:hypothetical protein L598_003100000020 [Mesorhizobium sp. J18]